MAARSECYIPESQAVEIIARNTTRALKAGLLVGDFHTYPQLYERAAKVIHNKEDLPFLDLEGKGRRKIAGHTVVAGHIVERVMGSMAQLST